MNIAHAKQLIPFESFVFDSEGKEFVFQGLDPQNDLYVECRAAVNGQITLDRAMCEIYPPCSNNTSEHDCDRCGAYTPNGEGLYLDRTMGGEVCDDRVCANCWDIHEAALRHKFKP